MQRISHVRAPLLIRATLHDVNDLAHTTCQNAFRLKREWQDTEPLHKATLASQGADLPFSVMPQQPAARQMCRNPLSGISSISDLCSEFGDCLDNCPGSVHRCYHAVAPNTSMGTHFITWKMFTSVELRGRLQISTRKEPARSKLNFL